MKQLSFVFIAVSVSFLSGPVEAFDWEFESAYHEKIAYIHVLENYCPHSLWQEVWEKNLFKKNGIRLNFGSIKSGTLLVDTRLNLNVELGNDFWFRLQSAWNDGGHRDVEKQEQLMGLEKRFWNSINLFFLVNMAMEKEEIDSQIGFMYIDESQEQYVRLAYVEDDLVYDSKNDQRGSSLKKPRGIRWQARYGMGKWHIFSEGNYSTGFERSYPDHELSPEFNFYAQQVYDGVLKLSIEPVPDALLEIGGDWYYFSEEKRYYQNGYTYHYANTLYDFVVRYLFMLTTQDRFRCGGHYLIQKSDAEGYQNFDYSRREIMPFLYYERLWRRHTFEFGYVGTIQQWDYGAAIHDEEYSYEGYADKVKFGWTYRFREDASLQLSVSHQIVAGEFGGGNVQLMFLF